MIAAAGVAAVTATDVIAGVLATPILDLDVLAVELPPAEVAWAATVNLVAFAAVLSIAGRLADALGRRGVLAVGLALYVLGASAVIVAPSWPVLVGARLGQGAGAALMAPAAPAILLAAFPERRRPAGVALWILAGAAGLLAMQAGGGWLAATFGWRGLFLPGAVLAAVLLLLAPALPRSPGSAGGTTNTYVGMVLLAPGAGAAVLVTARGGTWGWTSVPTLACAAAAVLLLTTAALVLRPAAPRDGAGGRIAWAMAASGVYGVAFLAFLTTVGPSWPVVVAMIAAVPPAAWAARRFSADAAVLAGAAALAAGCAITLFSPYLPVGALVAGAGLGALATGALVTGVAAAGRGNLAAAAGAVECARVAGAAGGMAGAALLTTNGGFGLHAGGLSTGPFGNPGNAMDMAGSGLMTAAGGTDPAISVPVACMAAAVLTAVVATWRMAAARRRSAQASLRAAQQEVASLRGLLLELRASFTEVRGQADRELARLGVPGVPDPHGQE